MIDYIIHDIIIDIYTDVQSRKGRRMSDDAINQAMSNYATAVDPCGMCRHWEHTNVTEICGQCCYYWGSKFDLDTRRDRGIRRG